MPVTLLGAGFGEGVEVFVGGAAVNLGELEGPPSRSQAQPGEFSVRFRAPELPPGDHAISLRQRDGSRSVVGLSLIYVVGPRIDSVDPAELLPDGGETVVVLGDGFAPGCVLSLFGVHAIELEYESRTRVRFRSPSQGTGPESGVLSITSAEGFSGRADGVLRYRALSPTLTSVTPNSAWTQGGKRVTIAGSDFHPRARVLIGATEAEVLERSRTSLDVVVPSGELGTVDITVIDPSGPTALLERAFTYEAIPMPPKIITITPNRGSTTGGLAIRIAGDNFNERTRARIGEITAVGKVIGTKVLDIELPKSLVTGVVAVELTHDGLSARLEDGFTYESAQAPRATGLDPTFGPASGGTRVTIEGVNFTPNVSVRFGGVSPKFVAVKSATQIDIVTPPCRAGFVDIEFISPDAGSSVMKKAFRVDALPAPLITTVAPTRGSVDGGTELSIEGKNFAEGVTVLFGKVPAKSTKRITGSVLEVKTPEGKDGEMVDVTVRNADGKEVTVRRAFCFDARYRG